MVHRSQIQVSESQCGLKSVISAQRACILVTVCNVIYIHSAIYRDYPGTAFVRNDAKVFRFCTSKYVMVSSLPIGVVYDYTLLIGAIKTSSKMIIQSTNVLFLLLVPLPNTRPG